MQREYIRDRLGKIIGSYTQENDGHTITLRNSTGAILGRYSSKDNRTRDYNGRILGQGNILATLLK